METQTAFYKRTMYIQNIYNTQSMPHQKKKKTANAQIIEKYSLSKIKFIFHTFERCLTFQEFFCCPLQVLQNIV